MSNQVNRIEFYKKFAMVSVNNMVLSETAKCYECKTNLQEFSIFIGESQRLSTLYDSCCSECLHIAVKRAIKKGIEDAEREIKKEEERLRFVNDVNKYNL